MCFGPKEFSGKLTRGAQMSAPTVWQHVLYVNTCVYILVHVCVSVCVSKIPLKWGFMIFKLAHASCRGLLSEPLIGCCLSVFFIWINWSPVWKMFMANGARRSWTAAYLPQFVRSVFSQPQSREDFPQRKKKKKIRVVSTRLSADRWLWSRTLSGANHASPAAWNTTEKASQYWWNTISHTDFIEFDVTGFDIYDDELI